MTDILILIVSSALLAVQIGVSAFIFYPDNFSISPGLSKLALTSNSVELDYSTNTDELNEARSKKELQDEQNKQLVRDLYQNIFNNKKLNQLENYYGQKYIQHNPDIPDGMEAIRNLLTALPPTFFVEIHHIGADGDFVYGHVKVIGLPDGRNRSAGDIFRIQDGKVVEHWDSIQVMPKMFANDHPFF